MEARPPVRPAEVTDRQREVARLVAEGKTNPEIAAALGISLDGAKYHVSELLGRLGLRRREEIGEWYREQRRGLRSVSFGLPLPWLLGGGAVAAVVAAVVVAAVMLLSREEGAPRLEDAVAPRGPLPEHGWDVTLSPNFRDTDFIVALEAGSTEPNREPRISLIDPAGFTAAVIRVSWAPGAAIRESTRQLVVTHGAYVEHQWRRELLVFDLANDLELVRTVALPGATRFDRPWVVPMVLSVDERRYFDPRTHWQDGPVPDGFLDVIDLEAGAVQTVPTGQQCYYGQPLPRDDGTMLMRGFDWCFSDIYRLSTTGEVVEEWRNWGYMGEHTGFHIAAIFLTEDGRPARIRRTGEVEILERTGETAVLPSIWEGGLGFEGYHLRGSRIATAVCCFGQPPTQAVVLFNTETLAVEHRIETSFVSFQPRPDGAGVWMLRTDGTIDSVDWDGRAESIPNVRISERARLMAW